MHIFRFHIASTTILLNKFSEDEFTTHFCCGFTKFNEQIK